MKKNNRATGPNNRCDGRERALAFGIIPKPDDGRVELIIRKQIVRSGEYFGNI